MDLGCGITLDIFTHVYYTGRLKFIRIYTDIKIIKRYISTIWARDIMRTSTRKYMDGISYKWTILMMGIKKNVVYK